jgi:cobalt-zinc-cadmium efflux system membrane fusion protein
LHLVDFQVGSVCVRPAFQRVAVLALVLAAACLAPTAWAQPRDAGVAPRGPSVPARPGSAAAPPTIGSTLGCVIEPAASAEVAAAAPGVLESVSVERGSPVRRGQVIATLQSEVERAALEAARARASAESEVNALAAARDLAKLKLKRMHALAQLDFGGRLELENAAAEFEIADHKLQQGREALAVAQRDHELAKRQLEQRQIRSPIDGVIADRLLNPGERVDGRPVVRVLAIDRLRAEVVVPAGRFGRIREGMHASVKAEGVDAPEVAARVVQVDRFVDAASGTFRARLSMRNVDGAVPAGVRCQVVFDDAGAPAVRPATTAPRVRPSRAASPET